ncbi:YifB family Mg chelatase-like AAA ATPase [Marinobacterium jannaschii]|uniref:YifB family Mg chelatase-like AAA ATPase n=1 Tax=Marinobacterium jannaschii TaxID=64970 RepID=UPI000484C9B9|nr:YifB family Mg chelatase-like AAA ATPase [Marinobacterium jannaschii]
MSLAIVHTRALVGISAPAVTVEVHLSGGLPAMAIVGLPETAVKESKERVRSALINAGFDYPQRRITINLAPADLPKEGGRFDLAIAIGILAASGQIPIQPLEQLELIGELALSGELRPVQGILPGAIACRDSQRQLLLAEGNGEEAALVAGLEVLPGGHLLDICSHLLGHQRIAALEVQATEALSAVADAGPDLNEVKGQAQARRALEVAAAGSHNLLLAGPPGSGKSMLASRLPGILPALNEREKMEVAAIHSVAGLRRDFRQPLLRPFRVPHHTASGVALVGGGSNPRPGEISLAHQGVLFLDELPEFNRKVLEVLREPLENGEILISRAARQTLFPARFQLVAAMNPCPCGYHNDGSDRCRCTPDQIHRYQDKISGPLLDRIDLHLWVAAISRDELMTPASPAEGSAAVRQRVMQARQRQQQRQGCANQALSGRMLEQHCALQPEDQSLLAQALERLRLSARAYHRILRVARTIADLAGSEAIQQPHLLEALSYRSGVGRGS